MTRSHACPTDRHDDLPVAHDGYAAFQRRDQRCAEKRGSAAVDHVFVLFRLTPAERRGTRLLGRDITTYRGAPIEAEQGSRMAPVVDHSDPDRPLIILCFPA